jgi:hypothetical protein
MTLFPTVGAAWPVLGPAARTLYRAAWPVLAQRLARCIEPHLISAAVCNNPSSFNINSDLVILRYGAAKSYNLVALCNEWIRSDLNILKAELYEAEVQWKDIILMFRDMELTQGQAITLCSAYVM